MKYVIPLLIAFIAWCFLSASWYVCTIKQLCSERSNAATSQVNKVSQAEEPHTSLPSTGEGKGAKEETPSENPVMDHYEVEEVDNKIIIHFPIASVHPELNPELGTYLNDFALKHKDSEEMVTVIGHTDNTGQADKNYQLGLRRAKAITEILIGKGMPRNRIKTTSKGEESPLESNDTPEGRDKNRRVELTID